ncbi:MAG TPA: TadE family protein [Pyrinomonadaceae bacterium]
MRHNSFSKNERGTSLAEFAIVATFFFMLIFGVIEFGRFLYTHNALTDASRRGARYAVLHLAPSSDPDGNTYDNPTCVRNAIMYGETHINPTTCAPLSGSPLLIHGIDAATIRVKYKGVDFDNDPATHNPYGTNLGTATVTIEGYVFQLNIPLFRRGVTMPTYATTLTAESAGHDPDPI